MKDKINDPKYASIQNKNSIIKNAENNIIKYYKAGYLKRKFPLHYNNIYEVRLQCLLAYSIILSQLNKSYLTNIKGMIGDTILYHTNKEEIKNNSINNNNIKLISFKIGTFFVDIFTLFPNNVFESEY